MKVTNLIQNVSSNYVDSSKQHLAAISEIIDIQPKNTSITWITESINHHMSELDKIPGKELVNIPKYTGLYGDTYLVTQDELEQFAHMFNKMSQLIPVHHTDSLAPMLSNIQNIISEIKKD